MPAPPLAEFLDGGAVEVLRVGIEFRQADEGDAAQIGDLRLLPDHAQALIAFDPAAIAVVLVDHDLTVASRRFGKPRR